jgi:hypothetical protein
MGNFYLTRTTNSESQYKYHFKKWWGSGKNIPSSGKRALVHIAQERAKFGKSMLVTYKGRPVQTRKLQREAKNMARGLLRLTTTAKTESQSLSFSSSSLFALTNGMWDFSPIYLHAKRMLINNIRFLKWNIPLGVRLQGIFDRVNSPSPLGAEIPLPKDFRIHTPPAVVGSQHEATSPTQLSAALTSMRIIERSCMFLQGNHNKLFKSMNRTDARLVVKGVRL